MRSALAMEIDALFVSGRYPALIDAANRDRDAVFADPVAVLQFGLACASSGALKEAAPPLRRALDLCPDDPSIMGALARVHVLLGNDAAAEQLIASLRSAARLDPAAAHQLADVYLQAGRSADAYEVAAAAVKSFDHPLLDIRLAEAAIRTRRIDIGVVAARRAAARLGRSPAVVNIAGPAALIADDRQWLSSLIAHLGRAPDEQAAAILDFWTGMLMSGDQMTAARTSAEMAAERAPSARRFRLVADLRLSTRDIAGAEAAARSALAIEPTDASATTLLARCKLFSGDVDQAKALLLGALEADPDCTIAFYYLTELDAAVVPGELRRRVEERIGADRLSADAKPKAMLALARCCEAAGDFGRAFNYVIDAKKRIAKAALAAGLGYSFEETDVTAARLRQAFPLKLSLPIRRQSPRTIFVVGMPRSGTSLTEQILSSHPDVFGAGERPEMINILSEFAAGAVDGDAAARLMVERAEEWRARYRAGLPHEALAADAVVDKHPLNFWSVGLILTLFPDARIVLLARAPVDVCLSILRYRFFARWTFVNEIEAVAHYYAAFERMSAYWRAAYPDRIHSMEYERLVAEPETEIRALLGYCSLPWDDACLDFHSTKRDVITHSAAQVRVPINTRAIERRKQYGGALKPLEEALARYGVTAQ